MSVALAADRAGGEMLARWTWSGLRTAMWRRIGLELRRLNRRLPARIVFMGDSLTLQWQEADPFFFRPGWIDRGIGGQTTIDMLARFERDVIAARPRAVHIMAGTNDLWHGRPGEDAADAIANIREMTAMARAAGIRVILAPPPPIAAEVAWRFGRPDLFDRLRALVAEHARAEGFVLVDYADVLLDEAGRLTPRFTTDGVHLSRAGYRAMRGLAEQAVRKAIS